MSLDEFMKHIEELRQQLNDIEEAKDLTDPDIVNASQKINAELAEYYSLLNNKAEQASSFTLPFN